jgi:DNA-binding CsgD family transcriptional regulator
MYQPKNFSDIAEPFSELSHREQQVVSLVCEGLSNKEIGRRLGVTEGTIKVHLNSIYEQLGVRSRIELMVALSGRESNPIDSFTASKREPAAVVGTLRRAWVVFEKEETTCISTLVWLAAIMNLSKVILVSPILVGDFGATV